MTVAARRESDYLIKARAAKCERMERVIGFLNGLTRPVRRGEIAKALGIRPHTLYLILRELQESGRVVWAHASPASVVGPGFWYAPTQEVLEPWLPEIRRLRPPSAVTIAHRRKRPEPPPADLGGNWLDTLVRH